MKRYDEAKHESPAMIDVAALKGQYVRRKPDAKTTYKVVGYDKAERRWQLDDVSDISRCIYVKPGTKLYAGFTY